jgi:hypothetical protein
VAHATQLLPDATHVLGSSSGSSGITRLCIRAATVTATGVRTQQRVEMPPPNASIFVLCTSPAASTSVLLLLLLLLLQNALKAS